MRLVLIFTGVGLWALSQAWRGIMPASPTLWGKSAAGQKMRPVQRVIFVLGGALLVAFGALVLFVFRNSH
jgi:hypothetical protein